jgi:YD repeat-containing protein
MGTAGRYRLGLVSGPWPTPHEVANIFPLQQEGVDQLAEGIKGRIAEGVSPLIVPTWLWEGQIIDGRQRYFACKKVDVEPTQQEWDGQGSLVSHLITIGLRHRQLDVNERSLVAMRAIPFLHAEVEAREKAGEKIDEHLGVPGREGRRKSQAAEQAAATVGVSTSSVEGASKVMKKGLPQL